MVAGLQKLPELKALTYNKNEFGVQSAEALCPILMKGMPMQMDELRLINTKVAVKAIEIIVEQLVERSYLKRLSLVNASISSEKCI